MKWCANCGTQLADDAVFCANCGTSVAPQEPQQQAPVQNSYVPEQPVYTAPQTGYVPEQPAYVQPQAPVTTPSEDVPSVGLNILSFLFPLVGLILFLAMKGTTPVKAKSIGKWALISVIVNVVLTVLLIGLIVVIGVVAGMSSGYYYY